MNPVRHHIPCSDVSPENSHVILVTDLYQLLCLENMDVLVLHTYFVVPYFILPLLVSNRNAGLTIMLVSSVLFTLKSLTEHHFPRVSSYFFE